ncbi:MAG: hypothetical protein EOO45_05710 [Flavobacterium sp.]|nr:MAG: hypothetical protein EOO45_05710 [Flavobacterium sp.]
MKKFLTLSLLALLFTACSTDDSGISQKEQNASEYGASNDESGNAYRVAGTTECFNTVTGYVYADGLNNPNLFFGVTASRTSKGYNSTCRVTLQIQRLSDCDDMASVTGTTISYVLPGTYVNFFAAPVGISIPSSNLPSGCYKWRFVTEGLSGTSIDCTTVSQWYESPLF